MGGELGYDGLVENVRKWIGRVIIALGVLALLACVVVTVAIDRRTSALVGLAGMAAVLIGCHTYWGLKHWRRAVVADGFGIIFAAFPLAEVVGPWGYAQMLGGVLILFVVLATWNPDY